MTGFASKRRAGQELGRLYRDWHGKALEPCAHCGYSFDQLSLGHWGCPNCEGEGLHPVDLKALGIRYQEQMALDGEPPCSH